MAKRFSSEFLYRIRNEISLIFLLKEILKHPCKHWEGFDHFLCPICNDFNTAINPKNNLARCFKCSKNFNNIDMIMIIKKIDFVQAVYFLRDLIGKKL